MKKSLLILLLSSLVVAGCTPVLPPEPINNGGEEPSLHTHTYSNVWSSNELTHWRESTCEHTGLKIDEAEHTFGSNNKCTVCGYEKELEIKTIYAIKITKNPAKTQYFVGESFDPTGMEVIVEYTDKTSEIITNYTYSTQVFTKEETIQFEISYQGKKTTVTLYVKEQKGSVEQEYTERIETSGSSFATLFNAGYHFDTEQHKLELANYFYDQVEYNNLITEVETDNLHAQKLGGVTYLQFGSGSNAVGSIEWKSIEKIYKVEIEVLCYAKEDTYHGTTNIDSWSHIAIDSTDFDLTYDGKTNPSVRKFYVDYPEGVKSFIVSSSLGRVYMKGMTITWRG